LVDRARQGRHDRPNSDVVPEMLEAEQARALVEAAALDRPIARVHAPDAWFLKRGLTPSAVRRSLRDRALVTARRRGKLLLLDTSDDGPVLAMHLGMSGRILVDGEAAGDPLLYAANGDNPAWRRFGLRFADGGTLFLRDPRRLGAVELDPDEDRLGPDALTLTRAQLVALLARSHAPIKAVLMDQSRVAGLGNLLADEVLWRAGIDPARPASSLPAAEVAHLHRTVRTTLRTLGRRGGSHTGDHMPARFPGGRCPRDGAALHRRTVGGRTTYSCPVHQH
jgi:formamidopyrimidine-DNA glycosylase